MASKAQQKQVFNNTATAGAGAIAAGFVNGALGDVLPAEIAKYNGLIPTVVGVLMQLQKGKTVQTAGLGMAAAGLATLTGSVLQGLEVGNPALRVGNNANVR